MTAYRFVTEEVRPGLWRAELSAKPFGALQIGLPQISKTMAVLTCARDYLLAGSRFSDRVSSLFAAIDDAIREIHEEAPAPLTLYRVMSPDYPACHWDTDQAAAIERAQQLVADAATENPSAPVQRVRFAQITADVLRSILNDPEEQIGPDGDAARIADSIELVKIVRPAPKDPLAEARELIEDLFGCCPDPETMKRAAKWLDANPEKDDSQ